MNLLSQKNIELYISTLVEDEVNFKNGVNNIKIKKVNKFNLLISNFIFILVSIYDFFILKILLYNKKFRQKKIVYTAYNFTNTINGKLEDRIVKPLFTENILFINQSKEIRLKKINNQKVYNIGGIVKLVKLFQFKKSYRMKFFYSYQIVNGWILSSFMSKEVYLLWFYDLNSLSIIFSSYRNKLKLIEVQHGSIINYPPYIKKGLIKLIDKFYVKNQLTIDYLKEHLCKDYDCEYSIIPYPIVNRFKKEGIHILYASTIDFGGLHPVFIKFLKTTDYKNLNIQIRLHPRERTKEIETLFSNQMKECNFEFIFDKSENWLDNNKIENLIVISPWSSSIEDSFDNGYTTIIIDEAGKNRFCHLIDNNKCYFSDDINSTLKKILS